MVEEENEEDDCRRGMRRMMIASRGVRRMVIEGNRKMVVK